MTIILTNGSEIFTDDCHFNDNDDICFKDLTGKPFNIPLQRVDDIVDGFQKSFTVKLIQSDKLQSYIERVKLASGEFDLNTISIDAINDTLTLEDKVQLLNVMKKRQQELKIVN